MARPRISAKATMQYRSDDVLRTVQVVVNETKADVARRKLNALFGV